MFLFTSRCDHNALSSCIGTDGIMEGRSFYSFMRLLLICALILTINTGYATELPEGIQLKACDNVDAGQPYLRMVTGKGTILVELHRDAAPKTVSKLIELVQTQADASVDNQEHTQNHYDRLEIAYTVPRVEIQTATPTALKDFKIPQEINAESFELDKEKVENSGRAMDIFQREIFRHFNKFKKHGKVSPALARWMQQWEENKNADFLIGVSRKEINEALDYVYQPDIKSYPVKLGSVMLKPRSHGSNGPKLVVALDDIPQRNGKWTVIGTVVDGMSVAHAISLLPSSDMKKPRFRPVDPVVIEKTEIVCECL